ncbi:MAG: HAD-IB family phosphatase [Gemmatimonadaceae bacterium]
MQSARPPAFATVIFDCDSTLCSIEGIEELAHGHRNAVAALTDAAMRGEFPLEAVYARRLELVRPTRDDIGRLGRRYVDTLVPDAGETVSVLRDCGVNVRIISGGVLQAVRILASALGVDEESVAAVELRFGPAPACEYAGFDEQSPLARAGGKRVQIERWHPVLTRPIMLVGDGATDLEARPAVDRFVAFAGVVEREIVVAQADDIVRAASLAPIIPLALGAPPRGRSARALFDRGAALLASDTARSSHTSLASE